MSKRENPAIASWMTFLKPSEVARLGEMSIARAEAIRERKRIVDRCRMREKRKAERDGV